MPCILLLKFANPKNSPQAKSQVEKIDDRAEQRKLKLRTFEQTLKLNSLNIFLLSADQRIF